MSWRTIGGFALTLLAASGCGGNGSMGGGGGTSGDSAGAGGGGGSGGGGGGGSSGVGSGAGALHVSIGPIDVGGGIETTQCILVKLPTTTDQDVVAIETTLAPGSHHLIAYRSSATTENLTPTPCSSFAGVLKGEAPIFIADSMSSKLQLPSGVSYHFPAGQMIRLEAHYINATQTAIKGAGTVTFTPGPAMTYQPADIMMCGSVKSLSCMFGPGLMPGKKLLALPVGTYDGGGLVDLTKLKVFGVTSHQHHRGTDVKIWKATASDPTATQIYDNPDWSNPPLTVYDDAHLLTFAPGEGLSWQCSYDTSTDTAPVCFGESAVTDEMCFIWAYYYPSIGRFISQSDCWAN
jgi:hypothetical protein